jgi:CRP-like cAMP-binding protein
VDPRFAEAIGYLGAVLVFLAFWTRDMVPLRIVAIASNVAFMIYGAVTGATPILLLHAALVPLNALRLIENVRAILACRRGRDLRFEALLARMHLREVQAGHVLFRRGDAADEWFYLISGEVRIPELGVTCRAGEFVGTFGVFMPARRHAVGAIAAAPCRLRVLDAERANRLLATHPEIALPLLRHTIARLTRHPEVAAVAQPAE